MRSGGPERGNACDHVPVIAQLRVKVKKVKKNIRVRKDWSILRRNEELKQQYTIEVNNRYDRLAEEIEGEGVEGEWRVLQGALVSAAEVVIPKEKRKKKKPWMTDEILDLMELRRRAKNISESRYRELDRLIQMMCRVKREKWLEARCREIEENEKVDSRAMANQIREWSGKKGMSRSTVIKDKNGNILTLIVKTNDIFH